MSADITEERTAATEEEIESGVSFSRHAIELHESRSAPWAKVILTLHDQLLSARSQLAALKAGTQGVDVPERREFALLRQHWQLWERETSAETQDALDDAANARDEVDDLLRKLSSRLPALKPGELDALENVAKCARDFHDRHINLSKTRDSYNHFLSDCRLESALKSLDTIRAPTEKETP
jgi:hypothetical protein